MKRVRSNLDNEDNDQPTAPKKSFVLTERQVALAEILAQFPENERRTKPVMRQALSAAFLSSVDPNINLYLQREPIFELAQYIANGWEYILRTNGAVTGIVWTQGLERFCEEIVADPAEDVKRAASRAGIELNSAKGLIKRKDVKDRIAALREDRKRRFEVRADRVLQQLVTIASSSFQDFIERTDDEGNIVFKDFGTLSPDEIYPIEQITRTRNGTGRYTSTSYKIKLESRGTARTLLMRHLGLLDGGGGEDAEEMGSAIRKWAANTEDFVPGGEV